MKTLYCVESAALFFYMKNKFCQQTILLYVCVCVCERERERESNCTEECLVILFVNFVYAVQTSRNVCEQLFKLFCNTFRRFSHACVASLPRKETGNVG